MNFNNAVFESATGRANQLPASTLPEIVFSGRSNVGKSSLINKLLGRKSLARVSATPGKTGTVNFYRLQDCRFVDLPGYGYARVSFSEKERWAELVEGYFRDERKICLVIQIVDLRHPPTKDDLQMLSFLRELGLPFAIVLTKSDKLNRTERTERTELLKSELEEYRDIKQIPFSALNGEGLDELKALLGELLQEYEGCNR